MKSHWFIRSFAVMAAIMMVTLVGCGVMKKAQEKKLSIACMNTLKQVGLAMAMHASNNADHFPLNENWIKTLADSNFIDAKTSVCPACKNTYTYLGNGQKTADIKDPSFAMLIICPDEHEGKKNVLFADGHVASLNPAEVDEAVKAAKDGALPVLKK